MYIYIYRLVYIYIYIYRLVYLKPLYIDTYMYIYIHNFLLFIHFEARLHATPEDKFKARSAILLFFLYIIPIHTFIYICNISIYLYYR